jgi:hypothetical protein
MSAVPRYAAAASKAHRIRNTLNGAVADANFVGNFQNAFASPQMIADALFNGCADARPTELKMLQTPRVRLTPRHRSARMVNPLEWAQHERAS